MAAQTREQGRYLGGRPPYGYRLADAGPHPNKAHAAWGRRAHRLEPDPATAPVVHWMFAQRLAGHSLLTGIRHLSMVGVPREQLRPARVLLTACGATTLALNVAWPVSAGAYGRAAFDAAGPLLLIGWAETGPGLLHHLYATRTPHSIPAPERSEEPATPADTTATGMIPVRTRTTAQPVSPDRGAGLPSAHRADRSAATTATAGLHELLRQAQRIDREHRIRYARAVSAETLRKDMRIGSARARALVKQVRELHSVNYMNPDADGQ